MSLTATLAAAIEKMRLAGMRRQGRFPTFLIIGVQRGGTTSFYNYLTEHPLVRPAARKEVHFFDVHFADGLGWYRSMFPLRPGGRKPDEITGEASPYYLFHPLVPRRIQPLFPEVKLIVLLRNPVDRALSHYHHEVRRGKETLSFADALQIEASRIQAAEVDPKPVAADFDRGHRFHSYRARGCYLDQLENWLPVFPRENFLFLLSEEFYAAPGDTMNRAANFLGLPPFNPRTDAYPIHNEAQYADMPPEVRDELREFYRPHNKRLAEFLGRDPGWD